MSVLRLKEVKGKGKAAITLPKALASQELLVSGQICQVKFGLLQTPATLVVDSEPTPPGMQPELKLSAEVISALKLIPDARYNLMVDSQKKVIAFGPVVGIFVNPRFIARLATGKPPKSAVYNGHAAWDTYAFVYYFSQAQIDWLNHTTRAWVCEEGRKWTYREVPLPDIFYDRGVHFRETEKPLVKYVRSQFQGHHSQVHCINSKDYLGKWEVHQLLSSHPEVKTFLPDTVRYTGIADVERMLQHYPRVFLKSFYGSCGTEIMVIHLTSKGTYRCRTAYKRSTVPSLGKLKALIEDFFDDKKLVIQQGLPLLQYQGSYLDMRILLQKNSRGEWCVTYNLVRIGNGDSPMTNVHLNGRAVLFMEIMPVILGSESEALAKDLELRNAALIIARCIEQEYGSFGEIGMDLALDRNGCVWMLEANAKPDKNLTPFNGFDVLYPHFTRIFEYSKHLSGFFPVVCQLN